MKLTKKSLMSTVFTTAIIMLLYLSGPSSAISVVLTSISNLYSGQTASLSATVTINDYEFIMTSGGVNLTLANSSGLVTYCALPINGTNTNLAVTCSDNTTATVSSSTSGGNYSYDRGYGYTSGYGYAPTYGYQSTYSYTYGYGYAVNTIWQSTDIAYTIGLPISSAYGTGTFTANVTVLSGSTPVSWSTQTFTVTSQDSLPGRGVAGARIAEVFMNPDGNDTTALTCDGEWVEIVNNGSSSVDLTGWIVGNAEGENITIGATTIWDGSSVTAAAGGYTVVCYNATMAYSDWIGNGGDSILLYNASGTLWDIISWDAADFASTSLVTTNESLANAMPSLFSVQSSGYYFVVNASVVLAANGTVTATNESSRGTVNPGWTNTLTITLMQDWNLISLPLTLTNNTVNESLSSIYGKYDLVYVFNKSSNSFKFYRPGGNPASNSLNDTSPKLGYWVNVNETTNSTNITHAGTIATLTQISLSNTTTGWNLVGYPTLATALVSSTFASIDGEYDLVYAFNKSSNSFKFYRPGGNAASNSINYTTPGRGYWVNINVSSATLNITGSSS